MPHQSGFLLGGMPKCSLWIRQATFLSKSMTPRKAMLDGVERGHGKTLIILVNSTLRIRRWCRRPRRVSPVPIGRQHIFPPGSWNHCLAFVSFGFSWPAMLQGCSLNVWVLWIGADCDLGCCLWPRPFTELWLLAMVLNV